MDTTARSIDGLDDFTPFIEAISAGFGERHDSDNPSRLARIPGLSIGVCHGDRPIGGCVSMEMDLTLPGGAQLPVAGLAAVGIDPSATGLGGMTAMMDLHLSEARRLGYVASVLTSSETGLYPRYGYGRISTVCRYEIDLSRARLRHDAPIAQGRVRLLLDQAEARAALVAAHVAAEGRAGMTSRTSEMWDVVLADKPNWTGGGDRFVAAHYSPGNTAADGYAIYRIKHLNGGQYLADALVRLDELVAAEPGVELALWEYLRRLPLARSLEWNHAPVDPIVVDYLADQRQLVQARRVDNLWLRVLDVGRLLSERSYPVDGEASFSLADDRFPDHSGLYRIRVSGGRADVEHLRGVSDALGAVALPLDHLATVLMGERRVVGLARSGLVRGDAGAFRAMDRLLSTDQAPFSLTRF